VRERRFDELGYPVNGYDEVVPGLFQADTTYSPLELFELGFDAVFDLCGWPRGEEVGGRPYVFLQIDDVPWIPDPQAIDDLAVSVATLVRGGSWVVVNCAAGLNRSGLLVGRALIELGHPARAAIELVRTARGPHALSNAAFSRWLLFERGGTRRERVDGRSELARRLAARRR
jgi:protein-tyrosine phosphatase